MGWRLVVRPPADEEFLALPAHIRLEFEEIVPSLMRGPLRSGLGYLVQEVRNHPGVWKLKLTTVPPRMFRAAFEIDGQVIRFLAFGPRPDFYRKLAQKNRGRAR